MSNCEYKISFGYRLRSIDGERYYLIDRYKAIELDEISLRLVNSIIANQGLTDLINELLQEYRVERIDLENDLNKVIADLLKNKVIKKI
jgi:hypothetical protein